MRNLVCILSVALLMAGCCPPCRAAELVSVPGVIANERVVNLPNDGEKWYLSVVGENGEASYERILAWFEKDANLRMLRKQVHFREIDSNTVIYKTRYVHNVEGLPTVRLQKHNGEVVYEAAGKNLPLSAGGLYGAMSNASSKAQDLGIFRPWKRGGLSPTPWDRMPWSRPNKPCPDGSCPIRPPVPPEDDPPPAPIDDGGAPEMAAQSGFDLGSAGIGAGSVLLCLLCGGGASLVVQWRRKYRQ